jgi:phage shock protein C
MNLADELERLNALHEKGVLNDAEFTLAKKRLLEGDAAYASNNKASREYSVLHRVARSKSDRWIGGVCGGLAEFSDVPAWAWRLLFVLLLLLHGLGLIVYLLLWIFVPLAKEKLVLLPEKIPMYGTNPEATKDEPKP